MVGGAGNSTGIWGAVAGLAADQAGLISRRQLLGLGMSPARARQRIDTGHWSAVFPGVYASFTGPLSDRARLWAALLYAGPQSCASHGTALWLAGALDRAPSMIQLVIPADRRVQPQPGLRIHVSRAFSARRHPSAQPPRTRIEDAALDVADAEPDVERALDAVFRVTQRRLSTASRLQAALTSRGRHRWRGLLNQVLTSVDDGVASALEHRYANDVERRHGLPPGERNQAETAPDGGSWYRDVRYRAWAAVVELDGLEAHPAELRFRDLRRDNQATVRGEIVLRYGWRDVAGRPCTVAGQVATVLRAQGWPGEPRPCGPRCPLGSARSA